MLSLNNKIKIIHNYKLLDLDLNSIKKDLSVEELSILLDSNLKNKDIELPLIYQKALVKQGLFNWQSNLKSKNILVLSILLCIDKSLKLNCLNKDNLKLIHIPVRCFKSYLENINKTYKSKFYGCSFEFIINDKSFDAYKISYLIINLLQMDINKSKFLMLFNCCYSLQENPTLDFLNRLNKLDTNIIEALKYFEYSTENDIKNILELLSKDDTNEFLMYLAKQQYISRYSDNIFKIENDKFKDKLIIVNKLENLLNVESLKNVITCFVELYFQLNLMKKFLYNIENSDSSCLTPANFYSILLNDSRFKELKNSTYINNLINYSIINRKKAFLKLVSNNINIINTSYKEKLIFNPIFCKIVNINSLNNTDLIYVTQDFVRQDILSMISDKISTSITLNEFKLLEEVSYIESCKNLINLYFSLDLSIDNKITTFKEIKNIKDSKILFSQLNDISSLVKCLNIKKLSDWINDYSYINGIDSKICWLILVNKVKLDKYLPDIRESYEIEFLLRNDVLNYTLNRLKSNILTIDKDCKELFQLLNLPEGFKKTYENNIAKFCLKNLSTLSLIYYKNSSLSKVQKENFLKIIKAELAGKLKYVKYYANSIEEELLVSNMDNNTKSCWIFNYESSSKNSEFFAKECDDYYSTMSVGVYPTRTCLSYINGEYSQCLLSNFDSNKKIIYVYYKSKIVGRAILRFSKTCENKMGKSLRFIDIVEDNIEKETDMKNNEKLILFLEKAYIGNISNVYYNRVMSEIIALSLLKAKNMGVTCLISNYYRDALDDQYYKKASNIFITRSKNGKQYLDSLQGVNKVDKEATYVSLSEVYIHI